MVCCDVVGLRLMGLPANVRQLTSAPGLPVSVIFFFVKGGVESQPCGIWGACFSCCRYPTTYLR